MNIDSELLVNTELSVSPMVIVTTLAAPGSYFTTTGSWTDQSGGWGYHGSNFYFTPGGNSNTGKWTYSLSGSFYSYAYIPNYPGSLASYARYTTSYAFQIRPASYVIKIFIRMGTVFQLLSIMVLLIFIIQKLTDPYQHHLRS